MGKSRARRARVRLSIHAMTIIACSATARAGVNFVHSAPLDFEGCQVDGFAVLPFEKGLFAGKGTLESPILYAPEPFDNLVGSWNADVPPGASVELRVQVRTDSDWSDWYGLGRWESGAGRSLRLQEDRFGKVDVDTLRLKEKASAFRYRVVMDAAGARLPRLYRVSLACLDAGAEIAPSSAPFAAGPWVRELKVAPRSQMAEQEKYRHDICSPTSLAMTLDYWGRKRTTLEVAELARDREVGIFGNWTINLAAASAEGLRGQVARLNSIEDLQEEIASGRPVVVSIAFGEGELPGAPIKKTQGHLLVVTGFTPEGDVRVNDPAAPDRKSVRRVYPRRDFESAWLRRKRGLAYILSKPFPQMMAVGLATADLREESKASRLPRVDDPGLLSQLLYGEKVKAVGAMGDWVKVEAVEQPVLRPSGGWRPYRGWVKAGALTTALMDLKPNAVVKAKRCRLKLDQPRPGDADLEFSMGTKLHLESEERGAAVVRLLDGRTARTDSSGLRRLDGRPASPERILQAAALFLGDAYVWGGRSSVQADPKWGVDCSGLVGLAYRSEGLDLPRDARDQFAGAKPIRRQGMRPADLVFLSDREGPKDVTHVMLYAGSDSLLESLRSAGIAERTSFQERFHKPLSGIESGDAVTDYGFNKPAKRRIFFGSFLHD